MMVLAWAAPGRRAKEKGHRLLRQVMALSVAPVRCSGVAISPAHVS
jgi:hypothetical protein